MMPSDHLQRRPKLWILKREPRVCWHATTSSFTRSPPAEDRVQNTKSRHFVVDDLPVQRSLGIAWNMTSDTFMFNIPEAQKPFTRRGVLSTINSVFDPLGFLAPVTVQGRMLLRELMSQGEEWDTPLPSELFSDSRGVSHKDGKPPCNSSTV